MSVFFVESKNTEMYGICMAERRMFVASFPYTGNPKELKSVSSYSRASCFSTTPPVFGANSGKHFLTPWKGVTSFNKFMMLVKETGWKLSNAVFKATCWEVVAWQVLNLKYGVSGNQDVPSISGFS